MSAAVLDTSALIAFIFDDEMERPAQVQFPDSLAQFHHEPRCPFTLDLMNRIEPKPVEPVLV